MYEKGNTENIQLKNHCVFCGKKPEKKSREHVIPKWLIKLTGDLNRKMTLPRINEDLKSEEIKISFSDLNTISCTKCNISFSKFEKDAKKVFNDLLIDKPLSSEDLNIILDFFDKIRVGLRINYLKINHNPFEINPKYYISSRLRQKDRLLLIYKTNFNKSTLQVIGANTLVFQLSPCCFGLILNNS